MDEYPIILFLGDMMPGENVYHLGRGIRTKYGHEFSSFIPPMIKQRLLDGVDAVVYNFEYSLAPDDFDFKDFESSIYASTISSLDIIPGSVVKIVNIANNHFWERGDERTKFTVETLKQKGFIVVGENSNPAIVEVKGHKLFFWGCSLIDWNVPVFTATYNNLLSKLSLPDIKGDKDVWLLSIHWGTEFMTYPNREQVKLGHELVKRGFDIIHGHHPHVFQPVERYDNGLIMYSMGNFVFDENFSFETQKSYCLKVEFKDRYHLTCSRIINRKYRPKSIQQIQEQKIAFIDGLYWSSSKKAIVSRLYNLLRKVEYLLHIADNDFYVYKSMKKRY